MKRFNRTNSIFFSKEINKFVIDKNDEDLSLFEKSLLRNNPDKYTTDRPLSKKEKEMNSSNLLDEEEDITDEEYERLLEKQKKKKLKNEQKMENRFWKMYDEYKKNPKKFKKGLSKNERRILRYFKEKNKKNGKKNISKEEKYIKHIRKTNPILYTFYLRDKDIEEEYQRRSEIITGIPFNNKKKKRRFFVGCNPNKTFTNNVRDYNNDQIELLENLEAEIMERLNSPELFTEGLEIKDFSSSSKKKKKLKEGDLTRLMLP